MTTYKRIVAVKEYVNCLLKRINSISVREFKRNRQIIFEAMHEALAG